MELISDQLRNKLSQELIEVYYNKSPDIIVEICRRLTLGGLQVSFKGSYITIILPPFVQQKPSQDGPQSLQRSTESLDECLMTSLKILERLGCKSPKGSPEEITNAIKGGFYP